MLELALSEEVMLLRTMFPLERFPFLCGVTRIQGDGLRALIGFLMTVLFTIRQFFAPIKVSPCHVSVMITLFSITQFSYMPSKQAMPCITALYGCLGSV